MERKYIVVFEFTTKGETSIPLEELFQEQWEQTPAYVEGDVLELVNYWEVK